MGGVWWFLRRPHPAAPPLDWAEAEFQRIEALQLLEQNEPERYAILMVTVLRCYLIRQFAVLQGSATTRELALALRREPTVPWERVFRLFEYVDLMKFAQATAALPDAQTMGADSRTLVRDIDAGLHSAVSAGRNA